MTETRGRSPDAIVDEAAERLAEILVAQWEQQQDVANAAYIPPRTEGATGHTASGRLVPRR